MHYKLVFSLSFQILTVDNYVALLPPNCYDYIVCQSNPSMKEAGQQKDYQTPIHLPDSIEIADTSGP